MQNTLALEKQQRPLNRPMRDLNRKTGKWVNVDSLILLWNCQKKKKVY